VQISFDLSGRDVWYAYYGLDPLNGGKPSHADETGVIVPNVPSAHPTDAITHKCLSQPVTFPMLNAARLYVSTLGPVLFPVDGGGNPIPPRPADPTDVNYKTPWDFFELTYIPSGNDGLFNFNLSNVQSANLPLGFHVEGADPSTRKPVSYTRGWLAGGYAKFITDLGGNKDFSGLVLPDSQRVLAPGTAIAAFDQKVISTALFAGDYLDAYVQQVWKKFEGVDLTFVGDPPAGSNTFVTWTARVRGGQFVFMTDDLPALEPIVLNVPSTSDLFENNFLFCASGGGTPGSLQQNYALQIFGTLCAAFNRSMMLTTTELANSSNCAWCRAVDQFYQNSTTNHYARAVHANVLDGLAYAFQSDDHCDVSSFVSAINPSELLIHLGA
jgi:hypothetical protein